MFVSIVLLSLVSLTLSTPHKCQQFPCGRAAPEVDQQEERAAVKIIVPFDAEVERSHKCQQFPCGRTIPKVEQHDESFEVERSHQCQQLPCGRTTPEASRIDLLTRDGGYKCSALCAILNAGSCENC